MTSLQLQVATQADEIESASIDLTHDTVLELVLAAGKRHTTPAATTAALQACWRQLASRTVDQRALVIEALREAVRNGTTTSRAWLPLALGETDPALIRAAVLGYLGVVPCSVDSRARAVEDVLQWFVRGLALDRVAVFAALLGLRDMAVNERLTLVRGRLTDAERDRVLGEFAAAADCITQEFIADWRACAADSSARA